jgi:hypothetical protein
MVDYNTNDRWKTYTIQSQGGLNSSTDTLSYKPGEASKLVNFEPSEFGGYRRINGFVKYDTNELSGSGNVLGVCVFDGASKTGVVACRGDNVYFSSGSGWGSAINTPARTGAGKYRFTKYHLSTGYRIAMCDGVNPAATWDGTTYTLINGTGSPTNPKYCTFWLRRLVLAGYSANLQAISITAPDTDDDFDGTNGAIELSVHDEITGIRAFREELYIFCRRSIFKLTGTSSANFTVIPIAANIGSIVPDSIQEFNGVLLFLTADGVRLIEGTQRIDDLEIATVSKPIYSIVRQAISTAGSTENISSVVIKSKNQYRLFYPATSAQESDSLGVLGAIRQGTNLENLNVPTAQMEWSELQGMKPYCCDSDYLNTTEYVVHGGFDGFVYRQEQGFGFNGTNIPAVYRTPPVALDDPELRKLVQKISLYTELEGAAAIVAKVIFDQGSTNVLQPESVTFNLGEGLFVYGGTTTLYGTATYGGSQHPRITQNVVGSGFLVQLEFSTNDMNAGYSIQGVSLQYKPLGRR